MNPYYAENLGIAYKDYSKLVRLANENGYVNPYEAESVGVPYFAWRAWQECYENEKE